jgi:hypothetical protein
MWFSQHVIHSKFQTIHSKVYCVVSPNLVILVRVQEAIHFQTTSLCCWVEFLSNYLCRNNRRRVTAEFRPEKALYFKKISESGQFFGHSRTDNQQTLGIFTKKEKFTILSLKKHFILKITTPVGCFHVSVGKLDRFVGYIKKRHPHSLFFSIFECQKWLTPIGGPIGARRAFFCAVGVISCPLRNAWLSSQVIAFTLIPNYVVKYEQTKQIEYT